MRAAHAVFPVSYDGEDVQKQGAGYGQAFITLEIIFSDMPEVLNIAIHDNSDEGEDDDGDNHDIQVLY